MESNWTNLVFHIKFRTQYTEIQHLNYCTEVQYWININLIRKDRQPNTENPLKLNLSGVIVKHLPYRGK